VAVMVSRITATFADAEKFADFIMDFWAGEALGGHAREFTVKELPPHS